MQVAGRDLSETAWLTALDPWVGLSMLWVAGALCGEVFARVLQVPRVLGYTMVGALSVLFGLGTSLPFSGDIRLLTDLALALLLFEIGGSVRFRWLLRNPGLLLTSVLESAASAVAVYVGLRSMGLDQPSALACGVFAMPASAAIAGRVAYELGADGQVTQRMALFTALNTFYGIVAVTVFKAWWLADQRAGWAAFGPGVLVSFFGAVAIGIVLGLLISAVTSNMNLRQESSVLLLLGLLILGQSLSHSLGVSTLLAPLTAGIFLRNWSKRPWSWPKHFGSAGGVLILMMFVIVGATWQLDYWRQSGLLALALVGLRWVAKGGVLMVIAPLSHSSLRQGAGLTMTLAPMSASVLILASDLVSVAPSLTSGVLPVIVSAVALMELLGPLMVQWGLRWVGDLPARSRQRVRDQPSRTSTTVTQTSANADRSSLDTPAVTAPNQEAP